MNIINYKEAIWWRNINERRINHVWQPRHGKTDNDRASGAKQRNASNKALREAWMNDPDRTGASHPTHTCNGHRYYRRLRGKKEAA